ncbi:MAG: thymidylate kinase [Acidobacteria bacterium]|nr:thymidylate kinase [Acidobacteriota bacterium]
MNRLNNRRRPVFVSFSGIDGAGKSTQIKNLCAFLNQAGLRVRLLAFWDHIAGLAGIREWMSLHLFKGDAGVGTPEKPVNRRDKNVESPYLNTLRFLLYFGDALRTNLLTAGLKKTDCDVVIFDRYLYDELANLPLTRSVARAYSALVGKLCPRPDVAFLVDADPEKARRRKPEYPLEFLKRNREAYLSLSRLVGMVVIAEGPEQEVSARVAQELVERTKSQIAWERSPVEAQPEGCVRPLS